MPMPINGRQIVKVEISGATYFTEEQDVNLYAQKLDLLKTYLT